MEQILGNRGALQRDQIKVQLDLGELFVDVGRFCKMTGFAAPTVYEQIRQQRFFLRTTYMGRKPYIAVEDFLNWYCSRLAQINTCPTQSEEE